MRKMIYLLLALTMVFAMSTTAFAAETSDGTITVSNPTADKEYNVYKVFNVTYSEDKSAYSYTIDSTSGFYDVVSSYSTGLKLTQVNDSTTYVVEKLESFSAAEFASKLSADTSKPDVAATAITSPAESSEVKWTGLSHGYYFVTSALGTVCSLTTTDPDATIIDKNEDIPFDKTVSDPDVEIGQTITYTITSEVPNTLGYTRFDYTVTDTMSKGLTFNRDVKVMFGNAYVTPSTDETNKARLTYTKNGQTLTEDETADGFALWFDMVQCQQYVGETITITYTATVNADAVIGAVGNDNGAELEYSNAPTDLTSKDKIEEKETVYTCEIVIDKYAACTNTGSNHEHNDDCQSNKLSDAKFVLYKEVTAEGETTTTKNYYKQDATTKAITWVTDIKDATTVTTSDKGVAKFEGLEAGTYYLEETEAPAGYNKLTASVTVTITRTTDNNQVIITGGTVDVPNSTGSKLPETGGMGTTIFYLVGGLLMAGAVVLLVTKKKMSAEK